MFKNKITVKLFVILLGCLILFTAMIVFIQFFVVSRMYSTTEYTVKRENDLSAELIKLNEVYSVIIENKAEEQNVITSMLSDYSTKNNAYFFIIDKNYNVKYIPKYQEPLAKTYLNSIQNTFKSQLAFNFDQDKRFRVNGILGLPSKYVTVFSSVKSKNEYIVAVTAEVHTSEDEKGLSTYVIYVFAFGIAVAILLAALFSFFITRPIVKIRNMAIKMARLEFDKRCEIESKDEIGDLSESLNFLSEKLDSTLKELYEANGKLKNDLEIQKEIDLLRKDFIAAVSHELKTPLTLIRGYTEGMQDHIVKEENIEGVQNIIVNEVDKMDRLVQELLDLSKLESAGYELNKQVFTLDEMLSNVAEKYSIVMKERKFQFDCVLNGSENQVNADQFRIEQVVTNFLNNAMANTTCDGVITLKSEVMADSVRVSIFNEGSPISKQDIIKIWDKFYRSDKSRSKKTGGTGLGLTICKAILEKHGSKFGVQNVEKGVESYFIMKVEK